MGIVEQYLLQLKIEKRRWRRAAAILTVLSLLVAVGVSWNLRMTGITLANDACCGYEEHQHTETCSQSEKLCEYEEHIHSIACYSDPNADVEDALIWQEMFAGYPYTGDLLKIWSVLPKHRLDMLRASLILRLTVVGHVTGIQGTVHGMVPPITNGRLCLYRSVSIMQARI